MPFCSLPAGIWKKPFYCGVGAPVQIVLLLGSSPGTKCVTKPYIKEHPAPLSSSLKELARTILQGGASQTSQPHKHPSTLLEDVLSSRHGLSTYGAVILVAGYSTRALV